MNNPYIINTSSHNTSVAKSLKNTRGKQPNQRHNKTSSQVRVFNVSYTDVILKYHAELKRKQKVKRINQRKERNDTLKHFRFPPKKLDKNTIEALTKQKKKIEKQLHNLSNTRLGNITEQSSENSRRDLLEVNSFMSFSDQHFDATPSLSNQQISSQHATDEIEVRPRQTCSQKIKQYCCSCFL